MADMPDTRPLRAQLTTALWSLKEDATWAWKQSLEGKSPDLATLGRAWKNVEAVVVAMDNETKQAA